MPGKDASATEKNTADAVVDKSPHFIKMLATHFQILKPILLLPPVTALLIAGSWLGSQCKSISSLEAESAVLQKAIAARSAGAGDDSSHSMLEPAAKLAKDQQPLDWKKTAAQLAETWGNGGMAGMGNMRTMARFEQRLQAMTREQLVTALDEIAALDLPNASREMLEMNILVPLTQKDPELVLTKYIDRLQDSAGMIGLRLSLAMQEMAKRDPGKATAWLDRQILAGKLDSKTLDGKSQSRIQFEGMLVSVLIGSDPDAAGRRLAAMPGDQRCDILTNFAVHEIKQDDQLAFAKLVRDQVPAKDQGSMLGDFASQVASEDSYPRVTEFLERIQATPVERTVCVEKAAESKIQRISYQRKVTREELDAMREWVTAQAPESTASVTGKALGNATGGNGKMNFAETSALAVEYNKVAGNDDVLTSFLASNAVWQNKEQARALAGGISDEKHRAEILGKLK